LSVLTAIWLAGRLPAYPISDRVYALGCGRDLARKAMADGADPVQAVAQACEHDAHSSDPILSMAVCQPQEYPPATVHTVKRRKSALS
jgi:hypothetical protein